MLLSIRFLLDVGSVNIYQYTSQVEFSAGDTQDLYFQIVDMAVDRADQGYSPPGRRYMPAANSTLVVEFLSVDCNKQVIRSATQPFPQDPSIWKVPILGTDPIKGTAMMKLKLIEPNRTLNITSGKGMVLRIQ